VTPARPVKRAKPRPKPIPPKIFVSIAAYRDPELLPTLRNCIQMAAHPEELRICIAWQHSPEDAWDTLEEFASDPHFDVIDIPFQKSKGACWARHEIQKRYRNEPYYFQLDSHHRFTKKWDDTLKDQLHYLEAVGHEKPLLSAYLPPYVPDQDPAQRGNAVLGVNIDRFMPQGVAYLKPYHMAQWNDLKGPFPARFISAHFIFTLGSFVKDVPYDPNIYFHGEETSLAARAFTHGYDLFSPHRVVVWHEYIRSAKSKHWSDSKDWGDRNNKSYARYRELFANPPSTETNGDGFGRFGFGRRRTLDEYERYAGVRFKDRRIHKETLKGELPPVKSDFDAGLTHTLKVCIDVFKESLKEADYDFFAVALLNKDGADDYRQDCNEEEIRALFHDPNDRFIHIWRTYDCERQPYMSRVWPHSRSKGWMERIEQLIPNE
jgi:hypothetical protein